MKQMAVDPVCGMQVDPETSRHVFDLGGARYAFCCGGCLTKFKADPKRFFGKSGAKPAATLVVPGARYICPMHPEVMQDGPGDCPKCGMALVPIGGIGAADDTDLLDLKRGLWVGSALSLPLFLLAMAPMVG